MRVLKKSAHGGKRVRRACGLSIIIMGVRRAYRLVIQHPGGMDDTLTREIDQCASQDFARLHRHLGGYMKEAQRRRGNIPMLSNVNKLLFVIALVMLLGGVGARPLRDDCGPAREVRAVLSALQYSHERGVVHRDIKPANIMLTADRRAKIDGFGVARINATFGRRRKLRGVERAESREQAILQRTAAQIVMMGRKGTRRARSAKRNAPHVENNAMIGVMHQTFASTCIIVDGVAMKCCYKAPAPDLARVW